MKKDYDAWRRVRVTAQGERVGGYERGAGKEGGESGGGRGRGERAYETDTSDEPRPACPLQWFNCEVDKDTGTS